MRYTPLHVHTDVSPDGAGTVQSLVNQASKMGLNALAMTDHGTLGNAVAFWSACTEANIKPIMGMEAYLMYEAKRYHITLLSTSEAGFNNLISLDSWAHSDGHVSGYPCVTMDKLREYRQGMFALTGCISSALYQEREQDALRYVADLRDAMGSDRIFMETMFIGTHDSWTRPLAFAERLGIAHVVTNDTHYPCQHQFAAHQVITQARKGYTYDSQQLWLKSADEIYRDGIRYADPDAVKRGLEMAYDIGIICQGFDMRSAPSLPSIPDAEATLIEDLVTMCKCDVSLYGDKKIRYERLKYEWSILKTRGFLDYIYILWDIVSWAKSQGIMVGPGRGSGGGSYVLYLLGITQVDPIRFGLLFERFINPGRADYPDVDVDFETDRREEVLNYAHDKWGTIPIATYSSYSHKSAIHDIARVMKIPKHLEEAAADDTKDSPAFEDFINYKSDALLAYDTMIGQIRHRGKHAAGVIIANRPVPIERSGDMLVAAWAEGMNTKDLSKVGIVKYDLLGLTALSQLKRMNELAPQNGITPVGPGNGFDDPKVFDLFCEGDVAGIFQWAGSDGIRELTMRVQPRNFYDLTTCNALYRPGALDAGTAKDYPMYMKTPRLLHPRLDPILEKTYGVICYQEQVMALVAEMMGGDLGQADLARRLISKADVGNPKWEAEIEKLRISFTLASASQGFEDTLIDTIWKEVYKHSGYSYNLSHATTYTMISYFMAWFKVYHREAFTTAMLQYDKDNAQTYIIDAVRHGVEVRTPNINTSSAQYDMVWSKNLNKHVIFVPLSDIAFLGDKAIDAILVERTANGGFVSYEDFAKRMPKRACNNRTKQMLERIGAFSDFTDAPHLAIEKYDEIPLTGPFTTQLEVLGYVIPTQKIIDKIDEALSAPVKKWQSAFAGFIRKIEKKKGPNGEYWVYHLSPSGSFWSREEQPRLKKGKFVTGTKTKFGHVGQFKTYKLE